MAKKPKDEPSVIDLKKTIMTAIVREYGDRPLTWETCERALQLAILEIKQTALFAPREKKK